MNFLALAFRNAAILNWWHDCLPEFQYVTLRSYATKHEWPLAEVDPEMTSEQDLNYLWQQYKHTITEHHNESL